jgi:PAS domain S-box-containing protein
VSAPPAELVTALLDRAEFGLAVVGADGRFRYVNDRLAAINGRSGDEHVGRTVREIVPELEPVITPVLARVMETGEPLLSAVVEGNTPATRDGRWQASYLPLPVDGEIGVGVILTEVTAREEAMAETARRLRQQAALADLGQLALAAADFDDVLDAATGMLARELDTRWAGVLVLEPGGDDLVMRAGTGFPAGSVGRLRGSAGAGSQAGYTIATGAPVVTDDAAHEERFTFTRALLDLGVRSAISVPVLGAGGPYGVVGVLSDEVGHFDAADAAFVRATATVLGAAAVRAAQEARLAELADQRGALAARTADSAEREQELLAGVLQDEALQHLLFARLELGAIAGADEEARARVEASLDTAVDLLRQVAGGLHPLTLEHGGLGAALAGLAGAHAGVAVEVGVAPAAEGLRDRLLFSLADALVGHAARSGASRARVDVSLDDGMIELRVADDGRGMAHDAFETSLGRGDIALATVRERVAAIDGTIAVSERTRGGRAAVTVRLPC